jgi:toxin-antitoxin system PIN domain toxin
MIIPDINLLIYAYNTGAPFHETAKLWWEERLSGYTSVGLTWIAVHGYLRIMTSTRILENPLRPEEALQDIEDWMKRDCVEIISPGPRHMKILSSLLESVGVAGNLTTDAVLAAISIEYQAELHSNDSDFSRFPGLKWVNPLRRVR